MIGFGAFEKLFDLSDNFLEALKPLFVELTSPLDFESENRKTKEDKQNAGPRSDHHDEAQNQKHKTDNHGQHPAHWMR